MVVKACRSLRPINENIESKKYSISCTGLGPGFTNVNLDCLEEHKTFRYLEDMFFTEKPVELGLFSLKEMTRGELCNGLLMQMQIL